MLAQVSLPRMDRTLIACTGSIDSCIIPDADENILAIAPGTADVQV